MSYVTGVLLCVLIFNNLACLWICVCFVIWTLLFPGLTNFGYSLRTSIFPTTRISYFKLTFKKYEVAIRGAERLTSVHGTPYRVGTSAEILYEVSGSSFDWVKGVADIPIVFLFELRDVGEFGFLLPTSQIIPNNEEIMASLVAMDHATRDLRYYSGASSVFMSISLVLSVASLVLFK